MQKKKKQLAKEDIRSFYYITHKDNLTSILERGIYSHQKIKDENIKATKIYDEEVISVRENKIVNSDSCLSQYANLYFQPRNPMLFRVLSEAGDGSYHKGVESIVLLEINRDIFEVENSYIATLNAATSEAQFYSNIDFAKGLFQIDNIILDNEAWWNDLAGGKQKIMAEFLVKDNIPPNYITAIYTASNSLQNDLSAKIKGKGIILDKIKFFIPNNIYPISNKIKLVDGDLFFSSAQTLTISVNTVGVMGKGLASRTRYQFPDIFVEYQDLCRQKKLDIGKLCLIKREKNMDDLLAYDPESLKNRNFLKWFLLFPTKKHWKNDSILEYIELGLQDLLAKYKQLGIESLALPALGCGLGKLTWHQVGPLMCHYLNQMDIKTLIYLPREITISEAELKAEFLLNKV